LHHFLLAAVAAATASPSPAPAAGHGNIFSQLFGWIPVLIASVINVINMGVHNLGISLILLAALIRLVFWPLNTAQFKSMIGMQKIAPKMKQLQAKYKSDPTKLQQETMALYKSEGVNPLAGCFPMLLQLPILFSVYYAVVTHRELYEQTSFLWIGTALSANSPVLFGNKILAASLAHPDILLIVLYIVGDGALLAFL
jgi:YidC/Oxa1 family membrane protein insertase